MISSFKNRALRWKCWPHISNWYSAECDSNFSMSPRWCLTMRFGALCRTRWQPPRSSLTSAATGRESSSSERTRCRSLLPGPARRHRPRAAWRRAAEGRRRARQVRGRTATSRPGALESITTSSRSPHPTSISKVSDRLNRHGVSRRQVLTPSTTLSFSHIVKEFI